MNTLSFQACRPASAGQLSFPLPTAPRELPSSVEPRERYSPGPKNPLPANLNASSRLQALARDGVIQMAPQRAALKLRRGELLEDGSQGKRVRQLQRMLNSEGSKLRRDGIYGPRTEREVRRFQKKHGLVADGIVGPKTLKKLNQEYLAAPQSAVKPEPAVKPAPQTAVKPAPQTVVKPAPQPTAKPEPQTAAKPEPKPTATVKDGFGLSDETVARLEKSGRLEAFRKLPAQVSGRYGQLSPQVRQQLYQQLNGSTWGVSHRDAFVRGSALGMDTFKMMGDKLNQAAAQGKISRREAEQLQADMQRLRALSPEQRSLVADVILWQRGR